MAINNPWVPGDPFSYDLKWIVRKIKEHQIILNGLDERIQNAIIAALENLDQLGPKYFESAADLISSDLKDKSIAYIEGFYSPGDMGANLYYVTTDYNDIIGADFYLTLDGPNRWALPIIVTPYVTPEMFGAKGDGVEDDTEAVKISLTYPDTILNGTSVYRITENLSIASGATVRGSSKTAAILCDGCHFGADANITGGNVDNFTMKDFHVLLPDGATGKALVFTSDTSYHDIYRFHVENIVVRHETLNPAGTNYGTGIYMAGALSGLFQNVYLHDFDEAVKCEYVTGRTTGANAITFVGGEIQSCNTGISASGLRNASFVNFTMEGCLTNAAHLTGGCDGVSFLNNYLEGNGTSDFLLDKTVVNEANKAITFDGIVGRASSASVSMFKLISAVGISIRNCTSRGGYTYTQFVENAGAAPADVIGTIEGCTDAFDNQYVISPFDETLHPSATKLIDKMTMFMKPVDRDFFDNNYADVTNTAGSETTLRTITIPANIMTRFGGVVEILIAGDYTGSSSASKSFKFNINGSTVKTSTTTQASGSWIAKIKLISNYNQTVRAVYEFSDQAMSDRAVAAQGDITGSNIVITLTGTCSDAAMRARQSYWKNA